MKKRIFLLFLIVAAIFSLTACAGKGSQPDGGKPQTDDDVFMFGPLSADELKPTLPDTVNYSLDHKDGDAYNSIYDYCAAARVEGGYYYFPIVSGVGKILRYYDTESGKSVPVCNKPDCSHNSRECNAVIEPGLQSNGLSYTWYYDGYIYSIAKDKEHYTWLYRNAADGSGGEKYMRLFKRDNSSIDEDGGVSVSWIEPAFSIYRGYLYFIDREEQPQSVTRMKLGSDVQEVIFKTEAGDDNFASISPPCGCGDYVFWGGTVGMSDGKEFVNGIFMYNTVTGKTDLVRRSDSDFHIIDGKMYYGEGTAIRCLDLKSGEDTLTAELGVPTKVFYIDENYCYITGNTYPEFTKLAIYDRQGKYVDTVNGDQTADITYHLYGGGDYLIALSASQADALILIDKSDIGGKTYSLTVLDAVGGVTEKEWNSSESDKIPGSGQEEKPGGENPDTPQKNDMKWRVEDDILTIYGNGDMESMEECITVIVEGEECITRYYPFNNPYDDKLWASIVKIVIDDGVTNVGNNAFCYFPKLEEVVIPESVTRIGVSAFIECNELSKINIPDSVKVIESYAFGNCWDLKEIVIPGSVKKIGLSVFRRCLNLKKAVLAEGVETVSERMFSLCENLKEVQLPDSLKTIGAEAFYRAPIQEITIPKNVKSIGRDAFAECRQLRKITAPEGLDLSGSGIIEDQVEIERY